jgi:hypothetical protein
MIAYDILKPIINNTLHLSLTHVTKEDISVLQSTVFYGTAGLVVNELKNNGFLIEVPDQISNLDLLFEHLSPGLVTILITCTNINIKYLFLTVDGHEIDFFAKYI